MSALPFMPLYVADYLADAAHLTTEEHGAYLLLIMTYWQRGKALPFEPDRLARIARLPSDRWTDVERTLSEFFTLEDGHWHHKRIDVELEKVRDKSEKAKRAGSASASARKSASAQQSSSECSTDVKRTLNHTDTDTDTDTEKERESARAPEPDHCVKMRAILKDQFLHLDDWEADFLRSTQWKPTLTKAQAESFKAILAKLDAKSAASGPVELLSVSRGTPGYEAWIAHYRRKNDGRASFHEGRDTLTVPSEFPPEVKAA